MKKWISVVLCVCLAIATVTFCGCSKQSEVKNQYEITAEYTPENATLRGTVKIAYENATDNEISLLKFALHPNAYRKDAVYKPVSSTYEKVAYYAGESHGETTVFSVHGAKSWEIGGEDENILYAYLERSLYPGDKVVLDIGFTVKLAKVKHRTGITPNTVNLGNFFPILCGYQKGGFYESVYYADGDPFFSECADFKVTLTTPKDYEVASSGVLQKEQSLEGKSKREYTVTNARDFALVLSKKYEVVTKRVQGVTLAYYYYADADAKRTLETVADCFDFYQSTFGAYPYATYTVAQTGFCRAGAEYPALTLLSDALTVEEKARAIAHETAHQWWYAVVGNNQVENAWQDESLAEYSALMFFEQYEKYGYNLQDGVRDALKEYRSYYDVYGSVLGRTDTRMVRHLKEYLSEYEYKCLAYDKGVVMLDSLRKSVGDKKFISALKRYYKNNTFKVASVESFISAFEKNGLDVDGFFDSFLYGKGAL